jgi:hypothetical protein
MILEKMGKNVKAINDSQVPESLLFLSQKNIIDPNLNIGDFNPDIIISLDASDF